jgi:ATP-dependent Clp protease ATP-binding subunit ClpC
VFERFTDRARQVVVLAQEEARTMGHDHIDTEHILLGLLRVEEGLAARALESLDITVDRARAEVVRVVGSGEEVTAGQLPFTPQAKKVLELALREALSLGHNYIGTEHILLGLARVNEGVAAVILEGLGADCEKVRNEVIRMLAGPRGRTEERKSKRTAAPQLGRAELPLSLRAQTVLDLARVEAADEGHNKVGTAHLLRALLREGEGELAGVDAPASRLRIELLRLLRPEEPRTHEDSAERPDE